jgi:hypothetical protein
METSNMFHLPRPLGTSILDSHAIPVRLSLTHCLTKLAQTEPNVTILISKH